MIFRFAFYPILTHCEATRYSVTMSHSSERVGPVLPAEITDIIIDHLHDQPHALSACSLTCSNWLPRSRLHRFRDVELMDTSKFSSFAALITGAPEIGDCVKKLVFRSHCDEHTHNYHVPGLGEPSCDRVCYPNVRTVVAAARDLRELRIDGLPLALFSAVSSSVESVSLSFVSMPPAADLTRWIRSLPSLRSLAVDLLAFESDHRIEFEIPEGAPAVAHSLDELQVSFVASLSWPSSFSEWLISERVGSQLRRLRVHSLGKSRGGINGGVKQLLRELGPSLELLEICINSDESGQPLQQRTFARCIC